MSREKIIGRMVKNSNAENGRMKREKKTDKIRNKLLAAWPAMSAQ